jgi:diguanylate cyclase (GGDEF)-like protein/PAS domain S-box-containing protein
MKVGCGTHGPGGFHVPQSQYEELGKILNSVPQVVWRADARGHADFFSAQWMKLYGGSPEELMGTGWLRYVHPEDIAGVIEARRTEGPKAKPWEIKLRIRQRDGTYRWTLIRSGPELDENARLICWYGVCLDIQDTVDSQEALRESEALYRSVLESSADCIKILDKNGRLLFLNPAGQSALELDDPAQLVGTEWLTAWPLGARPGVEQAMAQARTGSKARFSGYCPTAKGTPRWWDVILTPIPGKASEPGKILAVSRDVTSQVAQAEQLRWASEHDPLTSLPNRRAFENRLAEALEVAGERDKQVGLLLIDLDHFKHVNDRLGHEAGDRLLQNFTQELGQAVRSGDYVARLGGDEFAIILSDVKSSDDLVTIGAAILNRLKKPMAIGDQAVSVGASIGGAIFPLDANDCAGLIRCADTAMYALKAEGRGGTKIFLPEFRSEAQEAASQLNLGRSALTAASVEAAYQPKIDLNDRMILGYEALLRWHHPTFGLQLPETVSESFRNFEVATKIGSLMRDVVFGDIKAGRLELGAHQRIALNASPAEFLRDDFADNFLECLSHYGISGERVEIEITEQALAERHSAYISRAINQLKTAGIKIALDDFGTGHSSLAHLRDFPVDILKIDQTFVARLVTDESAEAIVRAVIALGQSLHIQVVAEGIENAEQASLLRDMGCRVGQGFYLGRPVTASALMRADEAA